MGGGGFRLHESITTYSKSTKLFAPQFPAILDIFISATRTEMGMKGEGGEEL